MIDLPADQVPGRWPRGRPSARPIPRCGPRCEWAQTDCAARGPAWPRIHPCDDRVHAGLDRDGPVSSATEAVCRQLHEQGFVGFGEIVRVFVGKLDQTEIAAVAADQAAPASQPRIGG